MRRIQFATVFTLVSLAAGSASALSGTVPELDPAPISSVAALLVAAALAFYDYRRKSNAAG